MIYFLGYVIAGFLVLLYDMKYADFEGYYKDGYENLVEELDAAGLDTRLSYKTYLYLCMLLTIVTWPMYVISYLITTFSIKDKR